MTKRLSPIRTLQDSLPGVGAQLIAPVKRIAAQPIIYNSIIADKKGYFDTSCISNQPSYLGNFYFASDWLVLDIPVQIDYQYGRFSELDKPISNFSFRYDRDNYLAGIKKKLGRKDGFKNLIPKVENPFANLKNEADQLLKKDLGVLNDQYHDLLSNHIAGLGSFDDLVNMDVKTLKEKLLNHEALTSIREKQTELEGLQHKLNSGVDVDKQHLESLKASIASFRGAEEMIRVVEKHKQSWQSSGLVKKLKDWDLMDQQRIAKLMNDPSTVLKAARQNLNLKGVQRFFLKINKLNIGQHTASAGSLSMQHFLNKGIGSELLNNKKYLSLLSGNNYKSIPLTDLPYANTVFSAVNAKSVSFGKGEMSKNFSRVSVASYEQGLNGLAMTGLNSFRKSIVTSFSKEFSIGSRGLITTEVSRSVSNYRGTGGNYSGGNSKVLDNIFSSDDLLQNTALSVQYQDEIPKHAFSYQLHVKRAANGYDNPGNAYLNQGSKEAGFTLRKTFLDRKLQIAIRNDIREFKYATSANPKWRNLSSSSDVRWKLKKGQTLSLRYLPTRMYRIEESYKQTFTRFDQLSLNANLNKRFHGLQYSSYASIAYQRDHYLLNTSAVGSKSLLLSANHTIALGRRLVYWNSQISHAENNTQLVYFNSMLNSEVGTTYTLLRKLQATTMIGYNSVKDWYKQAGVRQMFSFTINDRFSSDVFIDMRKNINVYQPLLFGLTRGEANLHYSLNK